MFTLSIIMDLEAAYKEASKRDCIWGLDNLERTRFAPSRQFRSGVEGAPIGAPAAATPAAPAGPTSADVGRPSKVSKKRCAGWVPGFGLADLLVGLTDLLVG